MNVSVKGQEKKIGQKEMGGVDKALTLINMEVKGQERKKSDGRG